MPHSLFIDIESSGLMMKGRPLDDPDQPWPVIVAAELVDDTGASLASFHTRVRADGRKVSQKASEIHGVSTRDAGRSGVSEIVVLGMLIGMVSQIGPGGCIVVQNVDFTRDLICSSLIRRQKSTEGWLRTGIKWVDIGDASTPFCAIPDGKDGYRRPTLYEAAATVLGKTSSTHNNPVVDIALLKELYGVMLNKGAI